MLHETPDAGQNIICNNYCYDDLCISYCNTDDNSFDYQIKSNSSNRITDIYNLFRFMASHERRIRIFTIYCRYIMGNTSCANHGSPHCSDECYISVNLCPPIYQRIFQAIYRPTCRDTLCYIRYMGCADNCSICEKYNCSIFQ